VLGKKVTGRVAVTKAADDTRCKSKGGNGRRKERGVRQRACNNTIIILKRQDARPDLKGKWIRRKGLTNGAPFKMKVREVAVLRGNNRKSVAVPTKDLRGVVQVGTVSKLQTREYAAHKTQEGVVCRNPTHYQ